LGSEARARRQASSQRGSPSIAIRAKTVYSAAMRYLVAALLAMLELAGCDTGDDKEFFYGGWMHPEKSSEQRLIER